MGDLSRFCLSCLGRWVLLFPKTAPESFKYWLSNHLIEGCCYKEATEPRVFLLVKLNSSLLMVYARHHDLVDRYGISVSQMTTEMFHLSQTLPGPFLTHDLSTSL